MGAAQDRARTKNQLVTACSQLVHSCAQVNQALLGSTDRILAIMARLTRAFARVFSHYGEARTNPAPGWA